MPTRLPVIAVFDIGKTNKKLLVFDVHYNVVKEEQIRFEEIADDDGFPCEDLNRLAAWVLEQFRQLKKAPEFQLRAVNFSTYGASVVCLDKRGKVAGNLYNYLKPYPAEVQKIFEEERGNAALFSQETSTPLMGHLNAGLQLYWIKKKKPDLFDQTAHVLHLPQYLCFLLTGKKFAEMTSVGCHSAMWNFKQMQYHSWLKEERVLPKLSMVVPGSHVVPVMNEYTGETVTTGIGLHDSSAAVIPYLLCFKEPFVILSTGTWSVSLNPFNTTLPAGRELAGGCLSYLSYQGCPVKTSMLFAGNDHDTQVLRIAEHFHVPGDFFKNVPLDPGYIRKIRMQNRVQALQKEDRAFSPTTPGVFHSRALSGFSSAGEAYHQLVADIIARQQQTSQMVLDGSDVNRVYVDGGFCRNGIYMQLLANAFPGKEVYAASMIQGTALGAALAIHTHWNREAVPENLVRLRRWPLEQPLPCSATSQL
ncbi:FGGY-family carbohydrate kinase [Niabella hirudinis]|uniref:FGGY-family carbohydrate kinase n=1 Tax=Niabella hirudinis TaxID=1285929 RepID=UPI003EBEB970